MAKYTVTRSCGHDEEVILFGKIQDREWRLERIETEKLCEECWKKALTEQRAKENAEAAHAAKEMNLPQLVGSEKQVAWAESIRQQMLVALDWFIYKSVKKEMRNDTKLREAVEHIKNKTAARWWIDHRDRNLTYEFKQMLQEAAKEVEEEKLQPAPEIVAEAKAEATVRPKNPKTETVAEIRVQDDVIEVIFPERREDFWKIIKKELRMEWSGKCWRRKLTAQNGTPANRAAEIGHRLLASGFIIRIYDAELRAQAIAGQYEPEYTNWVMCITSGEHEGWFAITWDRQKNDYYKAARAISGSRWSRPSVIIPPEQYQEILDFAEKYGFKLSARAHEVADAARQTRENMLVAKVEPPAEKTKVVADAKPGKLEVPTEVGVAEEFKD